MKQQVVGTVLKQSSEQICECSMCQVVLLVITVALRPMFEGWP